MYRQFFCFLKFLHCNNIIYRIDTIIIPNKIELARLKIIKGNKINTMSNCQSYRPHIIIILYQCIYLYILIFYIFIYNTQTVFRKEPIVPLFYRTFSIQNTAMK